MKQLLALALLWPAGGVLLAQESTAPGSSPAAKARPAAAAEKLAAKKPEDPLRAAFAGNPAASDQPVTTEIYANEAFFDSQNHIGTFTGRVIVNDPRFNLQADKLTVYLAKGEQQGLERAVAEGNVGVVREQPAAGGSAATRSIGRAEKAIYTAKDGNVELSGNPRVQSGLNTHVATSPETVMLINQSGVLQTRGPSRTEIRQEPKGAEPPKP